MFNHNIANNSPEKLYRCCIINSDIHGDTIFFMYKKTLASIAFIYAKYSTRRGICSMTAFNLKC